MKYKVRRFIFLVIILSLGAYLGSKDLSITLAGIGGVLVGYLAKAEDNQYERTKEHRAYE
ncbi:hypothetical protein ACWN8P_12660 [Vagococcus salmoninarum]|uniref:Uncharacterized protein n=1 Tax=Vagococcus salmoninarum TaxID=2739 RepID=A0A429ZSI4_9ENTE|nr:hypothetical protein [Vagococcus salmoninarum]RST96631.1 hypothetical protein CBF35_05205 [Vagococcus salmoninarum]